MNLNLFDDIDGIVLHERENAFVSADVDIRTDYDGETSRFPENMPLAMAYVPYQQWGETYGDDEALGRGTLFPELDLPFSGGGDSR